MTEEQLILANNALIYKIANRFYGIDRDDLYQAGITGVLKAYKNYVKNGTTKFSTYAYDYILGEMYELVYKEQKIKVSKDILRLHKKIEEARYDFALRNQYFPSNYELAEYLEIDVRLIEQATMSSYEVMSLDANDNNNDNRSIYESVPMKENISLDEHIALQEGLDSLSEDEKEIIKYRYYEDLTQGEVARKLNKTQVMVSRYEKKAISKMRKYVS